MSTHKTLAILFTILLVGSLKETLRIFDSNAPDIAGNRGELIAMAVSITLLFLFLTIRYWRKIQNKPRF